MSSPEGYRKSGPFPKEAGKAEREEVFAIASLQNRSYFLATDKCVLEFVFMADWLLRMHSHSNNIYA
jgi:hypothetical protein